jgi:transposase InsO family protein
VSRFAFVAAERTNHAVTRLCRIVGASVSGFYAWLRAIPAVQSRAEAEAGLRDHIDRIFAARRRAYGSPRVHAELRREGRRHSRRRVARLMCEMGLQARRGRRRTPRTTDSRHDLPVTPNLLDRNFAADRPDTVWLADISYLPTDEGWLYLAVVEDLATREIVGWSMADHLRAGLCVAALVMALPRRRPEPGLDPPQRPRGAVRRRALPTGAGTARHQAVHEPQGQLPRQRADGELLRFAEDGARPPHPLPHP